MTESMAQMIAATTSALKAGRVFICGRASFVRTNAWHTVSGLI
jgi:hypothetical protein